MSLLLLVAGHETTANMISLSTMAFLRDPEQLAVIKADPSKTVATSMIVTYRSISSTDIDELPFKDDANIYGLYQFSVTW